MVAKTISAALQGGDALRKHLLAIEHKLGRGAMVRVGFLENATYPSVYTSGNGRKGKARSTTSVAQVAFYNEFGAPGAGIPARPFMRATIASKSPRWGIGLGHALRKTNYDSVKAMAIMGEGIRGQIVHAITEWKDPPNSKRTEKIKGFNKPLIDEGIMQRSVDFQVLWDD